MCYDVKLVILLMLHDKGTREKTKIYVYFVYTKYICICEYTYTNIRKQGGNSHDNCRVHFCNQLCG